MSAPILLWDVMSTLVTEPFFETMPRFFGMTLQELLEQKDPHAWIDFEHGRIDEATFIARFFADRRPVDGDGLTAAMTAHYAYMPGVEALLERLADSGARMYALSNYPSWYRRIEAKLGLSRFLRWDFVSCETGHRKPAPEAYLHAARTLGVEPRECVFVDDQRANVEAARTLGMQAILRTEDVDALTRDLVGVGFDAARRSVIENSHDRLDQGGNTLKS